MDHKSGLDYQGDRKGVDKYLSRQTGLEKACGDAHGERQGKSRPLGRCRKAGTRDVRTVRRSGEHCRRGDAQGGAQDAHEVPFCETGDHGW